MSLKSLIWDYFDRVDDYKVKCNLCSSFLKIKGACTSNIGRHLRSNHPTFKLGESRLKPSTNELNVCNFENENVAGIENYQAPVKTVPRKIVQNTISSFYSKKINSEQRSNILIFRLVIKYFFIHIFIIQIYNI